MRAYVCMRVCVSGDNIVMNEKRFVLVCNLCQGAVTSKKTVYLRVSCATNCGVSV